MTKNSTTLKAILEEYKKWSLTHTPTWETDNLIGDILHWPTDYKGLCSPINTQEECRCKSGITPGMTRFIYSGKCPIHCSPVKTQEEECRCICHFPIKGNCYMPPCPHCSLTKEQECECHCHCDDKIPHTHEIDTVECSHCSKEQETCTTKQHETTNMLQKQEKDSIEQETTEDAACTQHGKEGCFHSVAPTIDWEEFNPELVKIFSKHLSFNDPMYAEENRRFILEVGSLFTKTMLKTLEKQKQDLIREIEGKKIKWIQGVSIEEQERFKHMWNAKINELISLIKKENI